MPDAECTRIGSNVWAPAAGLAWREWDGEMVVRSEATGSTHHLSPLGSRVLRALMHEAGGACVEKVTAEVARDTVGVEREALEAEVARSLAELAELHVVVRRRL